MPRLLLISVFCGSILAITHADDRVAGTTTLEGAWRLVAFRPAGGDELVRPPEGAEHAKLIAGGRFVWTEVRDGKITRAGAGKATIEGNAYIERIESVLGEQDAWMVGKTGTFQWYIRDGTLHVKGEIKTEDGVSQIDEEYERNK